MALEKAAAWETGGKEFNKEEDKEEEEEEEFNKDDHQTFSLKKKDIKNKLENSQGNSFSQTCANKLI